MASECSQRDQRSFSVSAWIVRDPAVQTVCGTCGTHVVIVHTPVAEIAIEPVEFEFPITACPKCKMDPRLQPTCNRCLGSGHIGYPTPYTAVAVDERDRARPWHRGVRRKRGEGLYPLHFCSGNHHSNRYEQHL